MEHAKAVKRASRLLWILVFLLVASGGMGELDEGSNCPYYDLRPRGEPDETSTILKVI